MVFPAALGALLTAYYWGWLAPYNYRFVILTWDAFRDVIASRRLLAGASPLADPLIEGEWFWYPPLNAGLFSALSALTRIDLLHLYAISPALLNWLFAPAFYMLALQLFDRRHAIAFIAALSLLGLPWAVTYVFAFPTVMAHAAGPALLVMAVYVRWLERRDRSLWLAVTGAGLMGLYHPPTCILLTAAIAGHLIFVDRRKAALAVGLIALISAPYWVVQIARPVLNPVPIRYISPAMLRWEVALPGFGWGLIAFAFMLAPAVPILWRRRGEGPAQFVFVLMAVSLIGQIPAYLVTALEPSYPALAAKIPVFVPHEFQLYWQISLVLAAGWGICAWFSRETPLARYPAGYWLVSLLLAAALAHWMILFPYRAQAFCEPYRLRGEWKGVVETMNERLGVHDVVCAPDDHVSFFVTALHTHAKCLASFESHLNPHADYHARAAARDAIMRTGDWSEAEQALQRFDVRYILAWAQKTSPERIDMFKAHCETVYDDGAVYLFRVPDGKK